MPPYSHSANGIVHVPSKCSVPETIRRLDCLVKSKGPAVFAPTTLAATPSKAGLRMRPTQLLIVGNPKAGRSN